MLGTVEKGKIIDENENAYYVQIDGITYELKKQEITQDDIPKVGDEIEVVGLKPTVKTTCTGIEMFRKLLDQGQAGDNTGLLLRGTKREDVERGQVLAKPGSITPHTGFEAEVSIKQTT